MSGSTRLCATAHFEPMARLRGAPVESPSPAYSIGRPAIWPLHIGFLLTLLVMVALPWASRLPRGAAWVSQYWPSDPISLVMLFVQGIPAAIMVYSLRLSLLPFAATFIASAATSVALHGSFDLDLACDDSLGIICLWTICGDVALAGAAAGLVSSSILVMIRALAAGSKDSDDPRGDPPVSG